MSSSHSAVIGVIGGTGVYKLAGLTDVEQVTVDTPYGQPSDAITLGTIHGVRCAFLARHGKGHRVLPTEINYRANIFALKKLGVKYLVTVSAVGSLREEHAPTNYVVVDQFIDRTKARDATFFGDGLIVHVTFGDPTCPRLSKLVEGAIRTALPAVKVTGKGTYVCMEGPAFSTRAESNMYRLWGGDVIGMTALTEAKLAREAEMAYACVAMVTDYDCWREGEAPVTVDEVMHTIKQNGDNSQVFVSEAIKQLAADLFVSPCHSSLANAILTPLSTVAEHRKRELEPILKPYLNAPEPQHH
eukprot:TRINITY_DN421_c0_g1_i1.p2 TRINITY_DN421_c0_g1~~TRINITY_DN421_c0_g1_i1.p2  ORF type:complete len:301 (+),score=80.07 TRINITY_DN421_c0_g1_i1:50-952(+)